VFATRPEVLPLISAAPLLLTLFTPKVDAGSAKVAMRSPVMRSN